jgi:hypothetical protein
MKIDEEVSMTIEEEVVEQVDQVEEGQIDLKKMDSKGVSNIDDSASLMNMDLCESIVDKFGARLREEVGAIVDSLKLDLLSEFQKRDNRIDELERVNLKQDNRIAELESELCLVRGSQAAATANVAALESKVADFAAKIESLSLASNVSVPAVPLPIIDTLVAGDSIVKHIDVSVIEGADNRLICCPGATAVKVLREVRDVAKSARIKNLVLHYGTNYIPQQSMSSIIREISDSLHRVQYELPDTSIHFSAILPKICNAANRGINIVNSCIRDLCRVLGIGFIQHEGFSREGVLQQKMYSPSEWKDGRPLHPSHKGAEALSINYKLHLLQ